MKCLLCSCEHENKIVDFGKVYHSVYMDEPEHQKYLKPKELALIKCPKCEFVQLSQILEPDSLYREYFYRSDANNSMVADLKDVYDGIQKTLVYPLKDNDIVVDIGANTGVLLGLYPKDVLTIGFDPANNLKEIAETRCSSFINDYFNSSLYAYKQKAKIISAIACFYDMPNPHQFLDEVVSILDDDGLFIIQMTDFTSMLRAKAFDNICFEHLAYYTLKQLDTLYEKHNLKIIKVEYNKVNGGSIRVYACKDWLDDGDPSYQYGRDISVSKSLVEESKFLQEYPTSLFVSDIIKSMRKVTAFIRNAQAKNKSVFALGASTKGSVLMQVFGLTKDDVPLCLEINPDKFEKYWSGCGTRIVDESNGFKADYLLVLPWHFHENFITKYRNIIDEGTTLIFPLPEPHIVNKDGEFPI